VPTGVRAALAITISDIASPPGLDPVEGRPPGTAGRRDMSFRLTAI
jgi:hypothetical protein